MKIKWVCDPMWPDGRRWLLTDDLGNEYARVMRFTYDRLVEAVTLNGRGVRGRTIGLFADYRSAAIATMKEFGVP